mgnify:CR=1 FL=1
MFGLLEPIYAHTEAVLCIDALCSTLDPSLYNEAGFDEKTVALLAPVLAYLFLPPGRARSLHAHYVLDKHFVAWCARAQGEALSGLSALMEPPNLHVTAKLCAARPPGPVMSCLAHTTY